MNLHRSQLHYLNKHISSYEMVQEKKDRHVGEMTEFLLAGEQMKSTMM